MAIAGNANEYDYIDFENIFNDSTLTVGQDYGNSSESSSSGLIAGGVESALYAYPFIARMIEVSRSKTCQVKGCGACGAVVINANWILTAAHCCTFKNKPNKKPDAYLSFQVGGHYDRSCEYSGRRNYFKYKLVL